MTDSQQIEHFADSLDQLIDRHRSEYDLSYAAVIGVLEMKIHSLLHESEEAQESDNE